MLFIVQGRAVLALTILVSSACTDAVGDQARPPVPLADAGAGDAHAEPGIPARGAIRVATFNVHRLFDTVCDSGNCAKASDFEEIVTQAELDQRLAELAASIVKLDADVVALQEIENAVVFDALRTRLDGYVTAELGETGAPASMDVAILSRGAVTEIRRHRDEPLVRPDGSATTFSRELLEARLTIKERRVFLFAAHFRSKVDDDPGRRFAEANKTREIMTAAAAEDPSALVVLGGDLNDEPGSDPIRALEGDGALVRVAQDLAPAAQATFALGGLALTLDHVFVTKGGASRYIPRSASVVPDLGSDHSALRADFDQK